MSRGGDSFRDRRTQAIVFTGLNQVEFRETGCPKPGPGEALIETSRTLVSTGTECTCLQRKFEPGSHWDEWVKYPFSPGYSNAGVVVELGSGVKNLKPGDRVATRTPHQKHVVAKEKDCVVIPEGVSDEEATWFGIACIVQNGVRRAEHEMGDVAVVIGLGLLGQLAVQFVRLMGAREIVAVDTAPVRLEMARAHGATVALQKGAGDVLPDLERLTGGRLADVVYDITGHPAVLAQALPLVRKFGKLILLGDPGNPSGQFITKEVITKGLSIIGAHDMHPPLEVTDHLYWTRPNQAALFMSYLQRKQMKVDDLITHRFKPEQAVEAYRRLVEDRATAMGLVFEWT